MEALGKIKTVAYKTIAVFIILFWILGRWIFRPVFKYNTITFFKHFSLYLVCRKNKTIDEWWGIFWLNWEKLKGDLKYSGKRIAILVFVIGAIYIVVQIGMHWVIYPLLYTTKYHVFVAPKMEIVLFENENELSHVMGCSCVPLDSIETKKGILTFHEKNIVFNLDNIMYVQEKLIQRFENKVSFVTPKMWKPLDESDRDLLHDIEFNPCILSVKKPSGDIIHLINPLIVHDKELVEQKQVAEPSAIFAYANAIKTNRFTKIKLRAMEYRHKMIDLWEITDFKMAVLIQHALDIMSGSIVNKLVPINANKTEEKVVTDASPGYKRTFIVQETNGKGEIVYTKGKLEL